MSAANEMKRPMPEFRKKPVSVVAVQWQGDLQALRELDPHNGAVRVEEGSGDLLIDTLEGTMHAHPGDWVMRGIVGELHPVRDDIFRRTYDPA